MTRKFSKQTLATLTMLSLNVAPLMLQSHQVLANTNRQSLYVEEQDCSFDVKEVKSNSKTTSGTASVSEDAWLTEGTEQYEVAKRIFEVFTQEYGTSGAFAAGVLSNVRGESNFIPDVLEGGHRAGMNTPTGPSYNSANPDQLGGGGLFQFTPYTKYSRDHLGRWWKARPGSDGWAIENQVDAVWELEFGNRQVQNFFSNTGKSNFSTVEDFISTTDPRLASEYFQMAYERPQHFHPERADWAEKANAVFNKDNIKADPSKFKFTTGSSTAVSVKVGSKKDDKTAGCVVGEEEISGGAWGKDGTGDHGLGELGASSRFFKREDLPDNLKQYALNPESIGVKWGDIPSWGFSPSRGADGLYGWGQCTDLSYSVMHNLWSRGSEKFATAGNGNMVVGNAVAAYGGKASTTPKAGAVFSSSGNSGAGHTGVVSHVFANGDFLIVEQNVIGYSGDSNGQRASWNYRVEGKAMIGALNYTFYYPDGWEVNKDAKTLK